MLAQWQEQQEKASASSFEIAQDEAVAIKDKYTNKQKLVRKRVDQYKIELRNPCRQGKKLLVLDIDYTLFDHRSTAENPLQLMRPFLHEFLTAAYAEYDIGLQPEWFDHQAIQEGHSGRDSDHELLKLTTYLLTIAELDDLSNLDHNNGQSCSEDNFKGRLRHQ